MIEEDENINPDNFTQRELLKHLYREVKKLVGEVHDLRGKSADASEVADLRRRITVAESRLMVLMEHKTIEKIENLTSQIESIKQSQSEQKGANKTWIIAVTVGLTILTLILKFLV